MATRRPLLAAALKESASYAMAMESMSEGQLFLGVPARQLSRQRPRRCVHAPISKLARFFPDTLRGLHVITMPTGSPYVLALDRNGTVVEEGELNEVDWWVALGRVGVSCD